MIFRPLTKFIRKIIGPKVSHAELPGLNPGDRILVHEIRSKNLTYLSDLKLASLLQTCSEIEEAGLAGIFIEAGCALGGSTALIACRKSMSRHMFVYDVFGIIPPPTELDTKDVHDRYATIISGQSKGINGDKYYGYQVDLYETVIRNLSLFGVDCEEQSIRLIKGLIEDTMVIDQPVAFAHIDVDWYEPVMTCMKRIWPLLVPGGSIILDDYHDWGGCRNAVDNFLQSVECPYVLDDSAGSLKITRR